MMKRTLSGVERMMYLLSERTSTNGFVSARVRGPLDDAKLRVALDRLSRRHPLLSARVVREQGVLAFTTEAVPPIPLRILSDDGSGQSFLEVAAAEVVAPLARSTGPLTRFTLVRHPDGTHADLMITVDHTIADGTACLYAIRDLLAFHESPDMAIDPTPLPPPVTQLFPAPTLDAAPPRPCRHRARTFQRRQCPSRRLTSCSPRQSFRASPCERSHDAAGSGA